MVKKRNIEKRTQEEITTLKKMIAIYCKGNHSKESTGPKGELCPQCANLADYALTRIDRCPFKETKDFCSNCKTHCYKPEMREQIRTVMRYSGPRMLLHHPIMAVKHLMSGRKSK